MTIEEQAEDLRRQQLHAWVLAYLEADPHNNTIQAVAAGSDAGFRQYYRYTVPDQAQALIAMDAPPDKENPAAFVEVAKLLAGAGVRVPEILAEDLQRGFLLLSDLGLETYLDVMAAPGFEPEQADSLFAEAIQALILSQLHIDASALPRYDEALLRRELELFPEWYLSRHLGIRVDGQLRALLDGLFDQLIPPLLSQNQVFVHRDYMPRNLMLSDTAAAARTAASGVGVLDFQDAVQGPISYDISCLFKDAFISWPEERVNSWLADYWQQARTAGLAVPADFDEFQRDCDYMSVQRHIKVIGIFARIYRRDGKSRYVDDVARFFDYLQTVAERRPELSALKTLLVMLDDG